ncbi:MAG TPA: radical SAM protein [Firmicutes bacterium]|nr:radical SAM protein [Candidatus Fermentithermobacillaceae bacterium]
MRQARIGDLKIHLREEPDSTGVLVVNSNAVLFLDKIALDYFNAFFAVWEQSAKSRRRETVATLDPVLAGEKLTPAVVRAITRRYRVPSERAAQDWGRLWNTVLAVATGSRCPFSDFEVRRVEPLSRELSAPYRVDLILTYRCQNNCAHCYAGGPRVTPELPTADWKDIIQKLADWGVPTLTFTGGEPLLREDLEDLVAYAGKCGCVTGLITNGRLLTRDRVQALFRAGLDFTQITLESSDPEIHDGMTGVEGSWAETVEGIKNSVPVIYTTTNTTVTQKNKETIPDTIRFLKSLRVSKFGINALIRSGRGVREEGLDPLELRSLLEEVIRLSAALDLPFIWYTPTCYRELNPVALGLGVKTCSAASTVLAVEPDGNVMPCQSYYKSIGNALKDDFPRIWRHPLAIALRRRRKGSQTPHPDFPGLPEKCLTCSELAMCGGSCPLERANPGPCR